MNDHSKETGRHLMLVETDRHGGNGTWIRQARLCGRSTTFNVPDPANENDHQIDTILTEQLPPAIQTAIAEWARHLKNQTWLLRRRAIKRFSESFADNFLAVKSHLSDDEYDSLVELGRTCLLEALDDGSPISDTHQARAYMESVHESHQARARAFLAASAPAPTTLH